MILAVLACAPRTAPPPVVDATSASTDSIEHEDEDEDEPLRLEDRQVKPTEEPGGPKWSLASREEVSATLKAISDTANRAGLQVHAFSRIDDIETDQYIMLPVEFEIHGTYHTVAKFFDEVSRMDPIVYANWLWLGSPEVDQDEVLVTVTGQFATFRFPGGEEPGAQDLVSDEKQQIIKLLKSRNDSGVHLLDELAKATPEKLRLTEIDTTGTQITLTGRAASNDDIAFFARSLESSEFFPSVYIDSVDRVTEDGVELKQFSMTAQFELVHRVLTSPGGEDGALEAILRMQAKYQYDPYGKRDPFLLFHEPPEQPKSPLQRFSLQEYTVLGTAQGPDHSEALVEDPDGEVYLVRVGDYLGREWGKISEIGRQQLVVREEFYSRDGDLLVTRKTLDGKRRKGKSHKAPAPLDLTRIDLSLHGVELGDVGRLRGCTRRATDLSRSGGCLALPGPEPAARA
jgi:hypothetical protein